MTVAMTASEGMVVHVRDPVSGRSLHRFSEKSLVERRAELQTIIAAIDDGLRTMPPGDSPDLPFDVADAVRTMETARRQYQKELDNAGFILGRLSGIGQDFGDSGGGGVGQGRPSASENILDKIREFLLSFGQEASNQQAQVSRGEYAGVGRLSEHEESGGRGTRVISGTRRADGSQICPPPERDRGGCSYGRWQIASKTGTMNMFLAWLVDNGGKTFAEKLYAAGGNHAAIAGDASFIAAWETLAKDMNFQALERSFIAATQYKPALKKVLLSVPDLLERDPVLQDVIWSLGVQHGPASPEVIFYQAIVNPDRSDRTRSGRYRPLTASEREALKAAVADLSDKELIEKVYALRAQRWPAHRARYARELAGALAALED
ncbi:MAG: hypothetical protein K1X75_04025 [Leptospirales bacterium]|nr:hypothetical protein [Leptospirales bacterium]